MANHVAWRRCGRAPGRVHGRQRGEYDREPYEPSHRGGAHNSANRPGSVRRLTFVACAVRAPAAKERTCSPPVQRCSYPWEPSRPVEVRHRRHERGGGAKGGPVIALDQIDQWRAQLKDEPSSFARDLAHVLLVEIGRLHAAELACERRFSAQQGAAIRARLATTECSTCSDVALRRMEEEIRIVRPRSDQQPAGARDHRDTCAGTAALLLTDRRY